MLSDCQSELGVSGDRMRETGKRERADSQEHQYPVGHRPVRDGEVTVTSFVSHVTFVSQSSVGSGGLCVSTAISGAYDRCKPASCQDTEGRLLQGPRTAGVGRSRPTSVAGAGKASAQGSCLARLGGVVMQR